MKEPALAILLMWGLAFPGRIFAEAEPSAASATPVAPARPEIKSEGMSLSEVMEITRLHNPVLKAGRAGIDAARGRGQQAGLYPNPEFEFEAEEMPTGSFGNLEKSVDTFVFAQEIVTAGKRKAAMAAAGKEVEISASEYAQREREVLTESKITFYSLLAAQEKVAVSTRVVQIAQKNALASQRRVEAGDVSPVDAVRANVALSRVKVELRNAERDRANAAQGLLRLMGAPDAALNSVGQTGALYRTTAAPGEEDALISALKRHPQLQGILRSRELAELEQWAAERDRWPNVEVAFGVETAPAEGGGREQSFILGVGIPLPIFDRNQGAIAEAKANRRRAEHELEAAEQELLSLLRQALRTYVSAREQAESYGKEIVPGARKAFDLVNRAYLAGDIGQVELLEAQQTLAESELEYIEALGELKEAQAELEGLIGQELE